MKIQAYKGDISQEYLNPFKDKNLYPFNKIGRVVVNKTTGEIIHILNENDSTLDENGYPVDIDNSVHEVMVYFPAFYAKREWTGDICKDSILTGIPDSIESEGFKVMDCFIREDGTIRPYVLVGAYLASEVAGQLRSVAGTKPSVSKTIAQFRDLARQGRDNKWNIMDFNTLTMLQFIYKIAFGDTNSQAVIGNGWTNKTEAPINGATAKLGNRSGYLDLFSNSPDKPDSRLVFGLQVKNERLVVYNSTTDRMSIKIDGNKSLEECIVEETDDYVIYCDGEKVRIDQYIPGTYDEYLEELKKLNSPKPLLHIEKQPIIDHFKILNDINNRKLKEINKNPQKYGLRISDLSVKIIPIPKYFCCRLDKKTKEIYINEGYENLVGLLNGFYNQTKNFDNNGYLTLTSTSNVVKSDPYTQTYYSVSTNNYFSDGEKCTQTCEVLSVANKNSFFQLKTFTPFNGLGDTARSLGLGDGEVVDIRTVQSGGSKVGWLFGSRLMGDYAIGDKIIVKWQITKTSTPKPFVKSIMPSSKMSILTNATSETHSFVMKGVITNVTGNVVRPLTFLDDSFGTAGNFEYNDVYFSNNTRLSSFVASNIYKKVFSSGSEYSLNQTISITGKPSTSIGLNVQEQNRRFDSFKQLLIYKGNLTETELKAESDKNIVLSDNRNLSLELPAKNNPISMLGLENFYGGCWQFVDGFYVKDDGYYIAKSPSQFGDIAQHTHYPATPVMGGTDNQHQEFYFKNVEKIGLTNIPRTTGGSASGFYTDYFWSHRKTQQNISLFGGDWANRLRAGVFCLYLSSVASNASSYVSARLVYLP